MASSNFKKFLDVSTGHLRKQDIEALEKYTGNPESDRPLKLICHPTEYGWIVSAGVLAVGSDAQAAAENVRALKEEGFSDEFIALLEHAHKNDAWMVQFDSDADYEPGFPVFDYGTDIDITEETFGAKA